MPNRWLVAPLSRKRPDLSSDPSPPAPLRTECKSIHTEILLPLTDRCRSAIAPRPGRPNGGRSRLSAPPSTSTALTNCATPASAGHQVKAAPDPVRQMEKRSAGILERSIDPEWSLRFVGSDKRRRSCLRYIHVGPSHFGNSAANGMTIADHAGESSLSMLG